MIAIYLHVKLVSHLFHNKLFVIMIRVIQALIRLIASITARKHVHNRQQQKKSATTEHGYGQIE